MSFALFYCYDLWALLLFSLYPKIHACASKGSLSLVFEGPLGMGEEIAWYKDEGRWRYGPYQLTSLYAIQLTHSFLTVLTSTFSVAGDVYYHLLTIFVSTHCLIFDLTKTNSSKDWIMAKRLANHSRIDQDDLSLSPKVERYVLNDPSLFLLSWILVRL